MNTHLPAPPPRSRSATSAPPSRCQQHRPPAEAQGNRPMNQLVRDWIAALRSRKYRRTEGRLHADGCYCATGVLGLLCGMKPIGNERSGYAMLYDQHRYSTYLPEAVIDATGTGRTRHQHGHALERRWPHLRPDRRLHPRAGASRLRPAMRTHNPKALALDLQRWTAEYHAAVSRGTWYGQSPTHRGSYRGTGRRRTRRSAGKGPRRYQSPLRA